MTVVNTDYPFVTGPVSAINNDAAVFDGISGKIIKDGGGGGGGVPGGSPGQIQYNNAGAFGGFGSFNGTLVTLPQTTTQQQQDIDEYNALTAGTK